jgi:hypothetical protein
MRLFAFECRKFCARIFSLVLMSDDTMGELLKLGIALPNVLFEARNAIVRKLQLLPNRDDIVSLLT